MKTHKYLISLSFIATLMLSGCGGSSAEDTNPPSSSEKQITFYLDMTSSGTSTIATLKKTILNVDTNYGNKTLNVWVSNDSFDDGDGCSKKTCITQEMVDELADTFLKAGSDNDIYDWITTIYGEEWSKSASDKYSDLIQETDSIDILLTDIDNDNSPNSGVVGYFWAKDNFTKDIYSGSNERIMFYIDSVMFANTDNGDFWQKEIYSTLAHEFHHMINFYQKNILRDTSLDTWIDEMLSETVEDAVATKIEHIGPRGVTPYDDGSAGDSGNTDGRYPTFNRYNYISLTEWYNSLANYSNVNAFGAFLTRNYGIEVLHDIEQSTYEHTDAIGYAVEKNDEDIKPTSISMSDELNQTIDINNTYQVEVLSPAYQTNLTININNAPKDIYLVLTNYSTSEATNLDITHSNKIVVAKNAKIVTVPPQSPIKPTPQHITDFNKQVLKPTIKRFNDESDNDYDEIFNTLLRDWGISVMLSDIINPYEKLTYNTGDFIESTYDGITYDLGSINFFNYSPQPTIHTDISSVNSQSNYYYIVGEDLNGSIDVNITLQDSMQATLIAK